MSDIDPGIDNAHDYIFSVVTAEMIAGTGPNLIGMDVGYAFVELQFCLLLLFNGLDLRVLGESLKPSQVGHTVRNVPDRISESKPGLYKRFEVSGKFQCDVELRVRTDSEFSFGGVLPEVGFLGQEFIQLGVQMGHITSSVNEVSSTDSRVRLTGRSEGPHVVLKRKTPASNFKVKG